MKWIAATLTVLVCTSACGYSRLRGAELFGNTTIVVMPFSGEYSLGGFTTELQNDLIKRLTRGGAIVVGDKTRAQAMLVGEIVDHQTKPAETARADASVPAYAVSARVRARLQNADGKTLWEHETRQQEVFLSGTAHTDRADVTLATEGLRRRALGRLAATIGHDLYEHLRFAGSPSAVKRK